MKSLSEPQKTRVWISAQEGGNVKKAFDACDSTYDFARLVEKVVRYYLYPPNANSELVLRSGRRVQRLLYLNLDKLSLAIEVFTVFLKRFFAQHPRISDPETKKEAMERGDVMYEAYLRSFRKFLEAGGSTKEFRDDLYDLIGSFEERYQSYLNTDKHAMSEGEGG